VVWHHLRGKPERPAFHYVLDPSNWLPTDKQVTTDFSHLQMDSPQYYIEVAPRPDASAKRK
jgi:hypothetical protein